MRVLLSIRPEFAQKILDGQKRYEFRRLIFKRQDIRTVVIYASAPVSKVVGEFEVVTILHESLDVLWRKTKPFAGISQEYFLDYFRNKSMGYAIAIGKSRKYDSPFDLKEVLGLAPPQSFLYLDNAPDFPEALQGSEVHRGGSGQEVTVSGDTSQTSLPVHSLSEITSSLRGLLDDGDWAARKAAQ